MKECKICKVQITSDNAYKYPRRKSLMNICKKCLVEENKKNRADKKEHYREYYKKYYHNKPTIRKRAWAKLREAIDRGEIIKKPCAICETTRNIEAHHFDYNKPLEVIWLCKKHHKETHRKLLK